MNLQVYYDNYNRRFFDNKLPKIHVHYGKLPRYALGVTRFKNRKPIAIVISKELRLTAAHGSLVLMTLLHEMCHVKLPYRFNHGQRFQKEMLRLAKIGAFKGLW